MKPLFLFIRPPRPQWPFNGPSTAFWPPLAFASMAAALREKVPALQVAILDAPALAMGWTTLGLHLRSLQPQFVAIGEEAVSCVESLRIATLAKALGARVIAGGCFFSWVAPQILPGKLVDIVVHGEGEQTIVELAHALLDASPRALRSVAGISFLDGEELVFTGWRDPLPNLDLLPIPAWDLLPMEKYGSRSHHHPAFASIEAGRGCSHGCRFCILWRQMGRFHGHRAVPHLRVKSAERLREEIRILMDRYHRRYLGWVDPCFNADPYLAATLSHLLLKENRVIGQSAWLRADCLLRDHDSGALTLWCDSGWNEAHLGVERMEPSELAFLGKGNLHGEVAGAANLLQSNYPRVVTFGSAIYGFPWDTPQTVRALFHSAERLPLDFIFFIPFTPLPGTPYWQSECWDSTGSAFRSFDFVPRPGSGAAHPALSSEIARNYLFRWSPQRLQKMAAGLFSTNSRRRGITWNIFLRVFPLLLASATHTRPNSTSGMVFPAWYES
jgi:anaerobic magnesium-protoporphyrin IX monomethyl ester cyclase